MLGTNAVMNWRGPWNFEPWRQQRLVVSGLRVLAVGILGPIAEELIFRGFLYARLNRTKLAGWMTIVVLAVAWALLHASYSSAVIGVLIVDGILLGVARQRSGSVVVPILMHVTWNLYAIW